MIFSPEKGNVFLVLAIVDTVRVIMAIITLRTGAPGS